MCKNINHIIFYVLSGLLLHFETVAKDIGELRTDKDVEAFMSEHFSYGKDIKLVGKEAYMDTLMYESEAIRPWTVFDFDRNGLKDLILTVDLKRAYLYIQILVMNFGPKNYEDYFLDQEPDEGYFIDLFMKAIDGREPKIQLLCSIKNCMNDDLKGEYVWKFGGLIEYNSKPLSEEKIQIKTIRSKPVLTFDKDTSQKSYTLGYIIDSNGYIEYNYLEKENLFVSLKGRLKNSSLIELKKIIAYMHPTRSGQEAMFISSNLAVHVTINGKADSLTAIRLSEKLYGRYSIYALHRQIEKFTKYKDWQRVDTISIDLLQFSDKKESDLITEFSQDPEYGLSPQKPIKIGNPSGIGSKFMTMENLNKSFLKVYPDSLYYLLDGTGEKICPCRNGFPLVEKIRLLTDQTQVRRKYIDIYITRYEFEEPKIPIVFRTH